MEDYKSIQEPRKKRQKKDDDRISSSPATTSSWEQVEEALSKQEDITDMLLDPKIADKVRNETLQEEKKGENRTFSITELYVNGAYPNQLLQFAWIRKPHKYFQEDLKPMMCPLKLDPQDIFSPFWISPDYPEKALKADEKLHALLRGHNINEEPKLPPVPDEVGILLQKIFQLIDSQPRNLQCLPAGSCR